jgi:hypothetical protein
MAIIKILRGQPSLAVRLVTQGAPGQQLVDYKNVRLVIMASREPRLEPPLSPQHFSGYWPGHDVESWNDQFVLPEELPLLVYPAFTVNDDGEIVFRFDDKINKRMGRYLGVIELNDGTILTTLDLDICTQIWVADRVTTERLD